MMKTAAQPQILSDLPATERRKNVFYPESKFGGFSDIDCSLLFYSRVHALLSPSSIVLDVGCGRGAYQDESSPLVRELRFLKGKVSKVIGVDVDSVGQFNPSLDEFRHLTANRWPVDDSAIDLAVADMVIEHLPEPELFFSEAQRVLRPGGFLCVRTTNRWSYVGIAAHVVPNRLHRSVLKQAGIERKAADDFPTLHRCNNVFRLRRMMRTHSFESACYGYDCEPTYLSRSPMYYALGVLHQRIAPKCLKVYLFGFGRKI